MKNFVVFTHGVYRTAHLDFYRKLCRSSIKIAVNGGLRFFLKAHIVPDLLIGDLDSLKNVRKASLRHTKVMTFPKRKDKTDLQLALEYSLNERADRIDIVLPSFGQPDHFLGNMMLVNIVGGQRRAGLLPKIRFVNIKYEILFVSDRSESFVDQIGDMVSVVPLSDFVVLTCTGTTYDVRKAKIERGQTRGLRNRVTSSKAAFDIKGQALLIHHLTP